MYMCVCVYIYIYIYIYIKDKYPSVMEERTGYTQNRKERSFTKKAFIT